VRVRRSTGAHGRQRRGRRRADAGRRQPVLPAARGARLARWGHARGRTVFGPGRKSREMRPRRSRCTACRVTHMLLPARLLLRRADEAAVIGAALAAAARGLGQRRIAAELEVPEDTVRGWLRRAAGRAGQVREAFTKVAAVMSADPVPLEPAGSRWPMRGVAVAAAAAAGAVAAAACGAADPAHYLGVGAVGPDAAAAVFPVGAERPARRSRAAAGVRPVPGRPPERAVDRGRPARPGHRRPEGLPVLESAVAFERPTGRLAGCRVPEVTRELMFRDRIGKSGFGLLLD
jgi:hypothetical protein